MTLPGFTVKTNQPNHHTNKTHQSFSIELNRKANSEDRLQLQECVDQVFQTNNNTPTIVKLCSLKDMCVDFCTQYARTIKSFGEMPHEMMLKIIKSPTVQDLVMYESLNPRLIGETDSQWREHVMKEYGTVGLRMYQLDGPTLMATKPDEMLWRQYYEFLQKQKELHIQQIAQQLQITQRQTKLANESRGVQLLDSKQVDKLLASKPSTSQLTPVQKQQLEQRKKYDSLMSRLRKEANDLSALRFGKTKPTVPGKMIFPKK